MLDFGLVNTYGPGTQHHFNPYESNGGGVVAIAGKDYVVIGADTRLSKGYGILTRHQEKVFTLSDNTVLASSGCWADSLQFRRVIESRMKVYEKNNGKVMSTEAVAQCSSILMYSRRFFPYYVSNMICGLDSKGEGAIYSYDPVGHCERCKYRATGSISALLQPLLDNQVGFKNQVGTVTKWDNWEDARDLIFDLFISAAERQIETGDEVSIYAITKDGEKHESRKLRRD